MRHRVESKRGNRNKSGGHLGSVLANLATSVILYERVKTTAPRAKLVKPMIEKFISIAKKKSSPEAMRVLNSLLPDPNAALKLTQELKKRYHDRSSGFVRLRRGGFRAGDSAQVMFIELV